MRLSILLEVKKKVISAPTEYTPPEGPIPKKIRDAADMKKMKNAVNKKINEITILAEEIKEQLIIMDDIMDSHTFETKVAEKKARVEIKSLESSLSLYSSKSITELNKLISMVIDRVIGEY